MGFIIGDMRTAVPCRIINGGIEINPILCDNIFIPVVDYLDVTGDWDNYIPIVKGVICHAENVSFKVTIYSDGRVLITTRDNIFYDMFEISLNVLETIGVDVIKMSSVRQYSISDKTLTPTKNMWSNDMICMARLISNHDMSRILIEDDVANILYEIDVNHPSNKELIEIGLKSLNMVLPIWVRTSNIENGLTDSNGYFWTLSKVADEPLAGRVFGKVVERCKLDPRFGGAYYETRLRYKS